MRYPTINDKMILGKCDYSHDCYKCTNSSCGITIHSGKDITKKCPECKHITEIHHVYHKRNFQIVIVETQTTIEDNGEA